MNYYLEHGTLAFLLIITVAYLGCGWQNILNCYKMWFNRAYWTNYNIVEALSWATKASIIIPGLIFGIQIWWFYFFALFTSVTLIWASHKKALPSLVAFNTIWVWIACVVLAQNLAK